MDAGCVERLCGATGAIIDEVRQAGDRLETGIVLMICALVPCRSRVRGYRRCVTPVARARQDGDSVAGSARQDVNSAAGSAVVVRTATHRRSRCQKTPETPGYPGAAAMLPVLATPSHGPHHSTQRSGVGVKCCGRHTTRAAVRCGRSLRPFRASGCLYGIAEEGRGEPVEM